MNPKKPVGKVRLKSTKKRTLSSKRWLERQLNDPFVHEAKKQGYRSRAAFKLIQIQEKFKILSNGKRIVDLGAAPGGWTQVCMKYVGSKGKVIAMDLKSIEPIPGALFIQGDFLNEQIQEHVKKECGQVDVVLSDMAAPACGISSVDHDRIMLLLENALDFAYQVLTNGGAFVAKVLRGGTEAEILKRLKTQFTKINHFKPEASRQDSAEMYLIAIGFKGNSKD